MPLVPVSPQDASRLLAVDNSAFFFDPSAVPVEAATSFMDWDSTFAATHPGDDEWIGIYTAYEMQVTAPGPLQRLTRLPMSGLSWVSVHPDHRRRGVLTEMIDHHLNRLHEQGVALSGLHAAEVPIYGRFGYAVSSLDVVLDLARGATFTAPSLDEAAGRVRTRFVAADSDEVAANLHKLHLRCAETTLGAVTRPEQMTRAVCLDLPLTRQGKEPRQVMFAQVDGSPSGYAIFQRRNSWERGNPSGLVAVSELAAVDPASLLALARRMVDFDLTTKVEIDARCVDDPLLWWLGGPRSAEMRAYDSLWLRLVDVDRAVTARGYGGPCDVVLDVLDRTCPWNQRRWRFTVDADGVGTCRPTDDRADVRLPVQALGAAYLGSRSLASQAAQGLVDELTPGSLQPLSRAWSTDREPIGSVEF